MKKRVMKATAKQVAALSKARAARKIGKGILKVKSSSTDVGYTDEVYKVVKVGSRFQLINTQGQPADAKVGSVMRRKAGTTGKALRGFKNKAGKDTFRLVPMEQYDMMVAPLPTEGIIATETATTHEDVKRIIHEDSIKMKPLELVISDIKWKYLVRSAVRAKNIMMTGPAGCGKTMAAKHLVKQLNRPEFYFNLGSTQDPRASLIGNTQFNKENGTYFSESAFVKAIKTPNAIILMDEMSRAHPDAWNILMTVLDQNQRYLRLDEAEGSPIVKVAEGVTFIATANIGNEYTATRVMDRAINDRFVTIEMDVLNSEQEFGLLKMMFPSVGDDDLKAVAEIASHTRDVSRNEVGKLSNMISTRAAVEMASLLYDGFNLMEAAEVSILPFFSQDGGLESERTYVKQLIQKYIKTTDEKLFNEPVGAEKKDAEEIVW
jgi:nitric oxide reductase NorQ protein